MKRSTCTKHPKTGVLHRRTTRSTVGVDHWHQIDDSNEICRALEVDATTRLPSNGAFNADHAAMLTFRSKLPACCCKCHRRNDCQWEFSNACTLLMQGPPTIFVGACSFKTFTFECSYALLPCSYCTGRRLMQGACTCGENNCGFDYATCLNSAPLSAYSTCGLTHINCQTKFQVCTVRCIEYLQSRGH